MPMAQDARRVHRMDLAIGRPKVSCLIGESGQPFRIPPELLGEELDRDLAIEVRVGRPPDLSHPALAERFRQPVVEERLARDVHEVDLRRNRW